VYAVLGNHDSVLMLPELERHGHPGAHERVGGDRARPDAALCLAGIDDAHFFGVENLREGARTAPRATRAPCCCRTRPRSTGRRLTPGVDLLLCGHTHGGQICLPGGYPVFLDARIPRRLGRGAWRYLEMQGYTSPGAGTSIAEVRLNCPPEITVHRLDVAGAP
jgi:uncharacterized protein